MRLFSTSVIALALASGFSTLVPAGFPQHMRAAAPSVPSTRLVIKARDKSTSLTAADLAPMPRTAITVLNAHTGKNENYAGVRLSDLLRTAGVPQGEEVKGDLFLIGIVAEGTDGYKVLYSLAEVDPALHTGEVLVADTLDGHPLGSDGVFRLVSTEDRRPARWVRNLSKITVVHMEP